MKPHEQRALETGEPQLGGVLDFLRLLWALDHGLQSRSKQMAVELGVTGPQRLVIRFAARFPQISAGQLARMLHVHPSTLTGVLQRLQARGLLVREQDPTDGRKALFRVTPKGRKLDQKHHGTVEGLVAAALADVPPDDLKVARRVLAALAERLDT